MTQVPQSRVKKRIYAGILGTIAAARLLMPLASKAFKKAEYEYDEEEGRGLFLGSAGEMIYCPERCRITPMGSGEAILQVEGTDHNHEWVIGGIPALDRYQEGLMLDAGAELGVADQDLLVGFEAYPVGGGDPIVKDPLTILQDARANFMDIDSGALFDRGRRDEPTRDTALQAPSTVKDAPIVAAQPTSASIFATKPQFTSADLMIAVAVTAGLTGLVTYGLTRGRGRR